jgi:hypothetical protein
VIGLTVERHHEVAGIWRLARLTAEVEREEERVRRELTAAQLAGRACAVCRREGVPLRFFTIVSGLPLYVCAAHGEEAV